MKSTEFRSSTGFQIFPWPGRFKTPIDLSSYLLSFAVAASTSFNFKFFLLQLTVMSRSSIFFYVKMSSLPTTPTHTNLKTKNVWKPQLYGP